MTPLFQGARYLLEGFTLIRQRGVRRFVIVPLLVNLTLFGALIFYGADRFGALVDAMLPEWLDWLRWLLWPLFALTVLVAAFFTFTLVANLIAAPFNSLLAAEIARRLGHDQTDTGESMWSTLRGVLPGMLGEVKKLLYFAAHAAPLGLLFLIPGLNLLAPPLWLGFCAWMLALEYSDYPLGLRGMDFPAQRALLRERRLLALGFGGAALFCTAIPLLNLLVMPAAVAGATAMWTRESIRIHLERQP